MKRTFSLGNVLILQMDSPSAMMSDHVTQEDIDCVMIERMVPPSIAKAYASTMDLLEDSCQ